MFDLIIRGGWVHDGTGAPGLRADVGVAGGRIAAVDRLPAGDGVPEIDATGRYVLPGLVDPHCHGDAALFDPAVQLALLRQGVTTVVLGQDGISFAPGSPSTVDYASRYFAAVNGAPPRPGPLTVADLLGGYSGATPVNAAYLVPHGTVRYEVLGPAKRPATGEELLAMRRLVEAGLADGAAGLSTGLEYEPGRYADAAELAHLCAPLAGRPYVSHLRAYEARAAVGMGEATEIGRRSGAPVHVSHYHGPGEALAGLVDHARDTGVDLTFDSYPYLRGSTIVAMVALPEYIPVADPPAALAMLAEPGVTADWDAELWPRISLSSVDSPEWTWTVGLRLPDAADHAGLDPAELLRRVLVATGLRAGAVFDHPPTNSEESIRRLLRHPAQMGGSDAIYQGTHPHPRGYGAFARMLGRHVRELGDWTWPEAAVHLAGHPARRFNLADRGLVRPGYAADLVVLDPAAVGDRATYEKPTELAAGVHDVLVNGVPVLAGGARTAATPGLGLTPR